jgi:hypothetical protein
MDPSVVLQFAMAVAMGLCSPLLIIFVMWKVAMMMISWALS